MNFSKEQKLAIDIRGKDILLSASAGSGKTTVMIERVVSLLKEGHDLSNMLIVTFTKAAAADMREKLANALIKDKELRSQLIKLADADISTLHAWCKKLIDQYFYLAGADPEVKLLERGSNVLLRKAADKAIAVYDSQFAVHNTDFETIKASTFSRSFYELQEIFSDNLGAEELKRIVVKMTEENNILPDGNDSVLCDEQCKKILLNEINARKSALKKQADELYQDALLINFQRNIIPIKELIVALELSTFDITTPKGALGKDPMFHIINEKYKILKDEVLDLLKKELLIKNAKNQNKDYIKILCALRDKTSEEFRAFKAKKGMLDFNDLEHYALKILKSDALSEIRQKYKFIFVDEYQDINPLQNNIIQMLKCPNNNLFLVGDIKQSIYAFRGCEPNIFARLYEEFKLRDDAAAIELNNNYRSKNEILNFVNKLFGKVMTKEFGGVDYEEEGKFVVKKERNAKEGVFCENESIKGRGGGEAVAINILPKDHQIKAAALRIAEILAYKNVKPSDIAVLVRSGLDSVVPLQDELNKAGIKLSLPKKDIFAAHLIEYLKLINNRFNDAFLINSLMGPFGNFSDVELAKIRMQFKDEEFFYEAADKFCFSQNMNSKFKKFFAALNHYRVLSLKLNALDLINQVVSDHNYFQTIFTHGVSAAESFESFLLSLNDKRHLTLNELLDDGMDEWELPADNDAVRVMTAHKSKGLEFEYVLILNAQKRFNLTDLNSSVLVHKGAAAIRAYDFEGGEVFDSNAHLFNKDRLKTRQLEEELRLLYVACTRAKRGLDIFAIKEKEVDVDKVKMTKNAVSWWDWLISVYREHEGNEFRGLDFGIGDESEKRGVILPSADVGLAEKLKDSMLREHIIDITQPKVYVTQAAKMQDETEEADIPGSLNAEGILSVDDKGIYFAGRRNNRLDNAAEIGTLYHTAMEIINFDSDFETEWENLHSKIKNSVDKVKIKTAVSEMKKLINGRKYYKEQGFIYKVCAKHFGGNKDNFVLMQGVIDLIILDENGAVIIDYKTGKGQNPEYQKQLFWYKKAAEDVLGLKNVETKLYLFDGIERT